MTIPVVCIAAMIPFSLVMGAFALRDGAHAADPDYDTAIGIDKPRGWLVTLAGIGCLCILGGIIAGVIRVAP